MRVVTWNIELGLDIDLAAHELTNRPELRDADVVLVQEMSPASTDVLAGLLGMSSLYHAAADHTKTNLPFGNAILSRWPLRDAEQVALPHVAPVDGQPRSALFATACVDGADVLFGSIHIETVLLDLRRRRRQLTRIADHVAQTVGPCVIGGDFNTASARSLKAFEGVFARVELNRVRTEDGPTFSRFGRGFALDHIFARGADLNAGGVVSAAASDHDPVWADFTL